GITGRGRLRDGGDHRDREPAHGPDRLRTLAERQRACGARDRTSRDRGSGFPRELSVKGDHRPEHRLSGMDSAFLYLERREIPLAIAGVFLFDGPIPFEDFVAAIDSRLPLIP